MKTITLAICTHNRSDLLERFLPINISALKGHGNAEILVVDNGSADGTPVVIERMAALAKSEGVSFRSVREDVLGLSAARNRAIDEFNTDVLAFLDDDAYVAESWVSAVTDGFEQDARLICAGGPVFPLFQLERPEWLVDEFLWAYSLDVRSTGSYSAKRHPLGVNMIFSRDKAKSIRFSQKLGRIGSDLLSAEETIIFDEMFASPSAVVKFLDLAIVHHFVDEKRLSKDWLSRRYEAEGRSRAIAAKVLNRPKLITSLKVISKILVATMLEKIVSEPKKFLMQVRIRCWQLHVRGIWK